MNCVGVDDLTAERAIFASNRRYNSYTVCASKTANASVTVIGRCDSRPKRN